MAVSPLPAAAAPEQFRRPRLILFYSPVSGRCRRAEAFLAQVLQRRRNHDTFELIRIAVDRRPDLAERFLVDEVPTVVVVENRKVRARIVAPSGSRELEAALQPWLR
ncbi:MAG: thioredoxin domain-containing protein [Gaiellaceae bacterium]